MGMSLAIVSQKGGVGKTTLAANLATAFADLTFKTLLIEIDPQGSLIQCFGLERFDLHHGLRGCLVSGGDPAEAVELGVRENLDLMPANVWSHEEEAELLAAVEKDVLGLRHLVRRFQEDYEYVILDCPPALGPLSRAALAAVDRYLVPVQAEAMNLASLDRLEHLAGEVRLTHNPELAVEGYVVTMANLRTRHAADVVEKLAGRYPDRLFETIIPRSIRVADEANRGRPTVTLSAANRAAKALQSLSEEILSRHSRERATARAVAAPTPVGSVEDEPSEELRAWESVLAELPTDDRPPVSPAGNGSLGWDD